MADIVTPAVRSRMMSGIRGKNTKPEILVRSFLHRRGLRFRLHSSKLPGRPDLVLPRYRSVVFVHGCFWHQHPGCRFAYMPKSNVERWQKKFSENRARDFEAVRALEAQGWSVFTIWECQVRDDAALEQLVDRIRNSP
jgi:DNA mismatch endonuclease (patch repair protein)